MLRSRSLLRRFTHFLLLAILAASTAGLNAQQPAVGLHYGSDFSTNQYENFGSWLGRKVMYRVSFLDKASWATLKEAALIDMSRRWVNSATGRVEVISMPMLANGELGGLASITRGTHDAVYRAIAAKIKSAGIANKVIIRLGWEGNGKWYLWSYLNDPAAFKAAFRRIAGIMRSTAPGLRFEFNISNLAERGSTGAKWTTGYPGDDVVDVISMDIYDHWHTWTAMRDGDAGLKEMRNFAIAHNKPEAYAEWALVDTSHGHGDNATFIRSMASWMAARPGKVLYHSYWNTTGGALIYSSKGTSVPKGAAAYKEVFGATPTASSSSSNTAPNIQSISDRTIDVNTSTGAIPFRIWDGQTDESNLKLITAVSDPTVIPESRVVLGGSGADRTVTITPLSSKTGWSTIWIKVSDGQLTKTVSFVVNVVANLSFGDVGSPAISGSHETDGANATMRASGKEIFNRADSFYYGTEWMKGDSEMIVKVSSLTNTHGSAKAGLMFRTSRASNSAFVGLFLTPSYGAVLQSRASTGAYASTIDSLPRKAAPEYLRLIRDGDAFYAFSGNNGVDWDYVGSTRVTMPETVLGGLAVCSYVPTTRTTAVFEGLSLD